MRTSEEHPEYLLGHAEAELERLIRQARLYEPISAHLLELAGIAPGMRVLDVGCGPGDLSFLASRLVGPRGRVVGIDASADAITLAQTRARSLHIENTQFAVRDLRELNDSVLQLGAAVRGQRFDAVIGRLVLMYLPDPAAVLGQLSSYVNPGGVVTFQEMDVSTARSDPRCEVYETAIERIRAAFTYRRFDLRFGAAQSRIFRAARLPAPAMLLEVYLGNAADADYTHVCEVMRTLLPVFASAGICSAEEVGIDTLARRMREEAVRRDAMLTGPGLVGAWTRVPGS